LNTPSLLYYTASIFKDNDRTEDSAGDNMKQPLIIVSSSNESLKDEEQATLSLARKAEQPEASSASKASFSEVL
jgi:hypothetical protein